MKILELVTKLKVIYDEHGDLDIKLQEAERGYPYNVDYLYTEVAEEGHYPKSLNIPGGYTFVKLGVYF